MIVITVLLIVFLLLAIILMSFIGIYTFIAAPIKGLMVGVLYDVEDYIEYEIKEHTIQIVIWFASFTFTWETPLNN
jgi:hypothetical protein